MPDRYCFFSTVHYPGYWTVNTQNKLSTRRISEQTSELIYSCAEQAAKYKAGEITKDEYDKWRYNYPKYDTTEHWYKVLSQELSDAMVETF